VKVVLKTDEYTIFQRRDERYAVKDADKAWVNGDAKITILLENKLIEAAAPKQPEPEPEPEPEVEAPVAEEASADEAPAEEAPAAEAADAEAPAEDAAPEADAEKDK